MGQRSQLYIRYKNGKNLVAMHLQWNYGFYMVNRTYQLLEYIKKNVNNGYSNFKEENFYIANSEEKREDIDILQNLIQMNTTIGSYVSGCDLVKEELIYGNEDVKTFKMNPYKQHNNNGILVVDIKEDGTIKYGIGGGYEEVGNEDYNMISAREYFELGEKDIENEYKLINRNKELYEKIMEQLNFIDNFEILTNKERDDIFNTEYQYDNCIKPIDLKELRMKKIEKNIITYIDCLLDEDELTTKDKNKLMKIKNDEIKLSKLVKRIYMENILSTIYDVKYYVNELLNVVV